MLGLDAYLQNLNDLHTLSVRTRACVHMYVCFWYQTSPSTYSICLKHIKILKGCTQSCTRSLFHNVCTVDHHSIYEMVQNGVY